MNNVRLVNPGSTAAIAISAATLLAAGCASQHDVDNTTGQQNYCPKNMALECFESPTRETKCSCVTPQELERTVEQVLGR